MTPKRRLALFLVISVELHVLFLIVLTGQLGSLSGPRTLSGITLIEVFRLGSRGAEARIVDTPAVLLERTPDLKPVKDPTPIPSFHREQHDPDRTNASNGAAEKYDRAGDRTDRVMPGIPDGAGDTPEVDPATDARELPGGSALPPAAEPAVPEYAPARCASCPKPSYPTLAERRGLEGEVEVTYMVLPDGSVGDIYVSRSSGFPSLDEALLETVKKWTYFPATLDGVAVSEQKKCTQSFAIRAP